MTARYVVSAQPDIAVAPASDRYTREVKAAVSACEIAELAPALYALPTSLFSASAL